jgi:hypothetical protein
VVPCGGVRWAVSEARPKERAEMRALEATGLVEDMRSAAAAAPCDVAHRGALICDDR